MLDMAGGVVVAPAAPPMPTGGVDALPAATPGGELTAAAATGCGKPAAA